MSVSLDAAEDLAKRYTAAWNTGRPEAVAEFFAETGGIVINRGTPWEARAGITKMAAGFFADVPNLALVCDGVRLAGTHIDEGMGHGQDGVPSLSRPSGPSASPFETLKKDLPQVSSLLSGLNMQVSKVRDTTMQGASGISTFMEKLGTGIQGFADMFGEAIGIIDQTVQQMFANQAAAIDSNYQKQLAAINGSRMSEEQKQKAIQSLDEATDKKKRALMRKQAVREKVMALFQAAINTAGAIINALKTDPTGILAAIIGGISAVQIGLIAGAKIPALAKGGLAYGPQMAMVGDNPGARVDPEVIAPLSKLQAMMGMGGGKQEVIVKGVIAGKDILLVHERAQQDRQRTRGF